MLPSRRDFLKQASLLALTPTVPGFLAQTASAAEHARNGHVLVVLQLDGGNDGLNTVVPFADEQYARLRKRLRLPTQELIKLDDRSGLHPALRPAARLLERGQLAIVQGVGYPNPNRSHFRSMAIWHTARFDPEEHTGLGWLGRALDERPMRSGEPGSFFVGMEAPPVALRGRQSTTSALARLEDFVIAPNAAVAPATTEHINDLAAFVRQTTLDAYATAQQVQQAVRTQEQGPSYPATALAGRLRLIARLLKAGFATSVFYTLQPGYDTHGMQLVAHAALLEELAGALRAFFDDLAACKLAERVVVLAFSEFGRTVRENASSGTDHGTAGPVFLAGPSVKGGLTGTPPSLTDLVEGEPKMTVDFRRVYATVLQDWLGLEPVAAMHGSFARLPLFRS